MVRSTDDGADGLWPEHLAALEAFLVVQDQWRVIAGFGGAYWAGLDYSACEAGLRLSGLEVPPSVWDQVRLIEDGAKQELNGR